MRNSQINASALSGYRKHFTNDTFSYGNATIIKIFTVKQCQNFITVYKYYYFRKQFLSLFQI